MAPCGTLFGSWPELIGQVAALYPCNCERLFHGPDTGVEEHGSGVYGTQRNMRTVRAMPGRAWCVALSGFGSSMWAPRSRVRQSQTQLEWVDAASGAGGTARDRSGGSRGSAYPALATVHG